LIGNMSGGDIVGRGGGGREKKGRKACTEKTFVEIGGGCEGGPPVLNHCKIL